jgi:hypothetical protein
MINRRTVAAILAKKFINDYDEVMKHYTVEQQVELTGHLLQVIELMQEYQESNDDKLFKKLQKEEMALTAKYKGTLKPYKTKSFHKYFQYDIILAEKGLYTSEEYNKLPGDEQGLSENEIKSFLLTCQKSLNNSLERLYLQEPSGKTQPSTEESLNGQSDKDITRSRQMLAIYYLLKAGFNIEHRKSSNVSDVAKFVHLMTGTKYSGLSNSEIYKKYKAIPSLKEGAELVKDLKFIRPYFESLEINEAVKMINADIEKALLDIPHAERKKYRD